MEKIIKAGVLTLGCKVNQYESDAIMRELAKNDVVIASSDDICDIYIINTCSVTAESDRKSRQFIRRCISKNPNAVIIVTGCFAQINPEKVAKIEGVDFICGNNAKSIIPKKALELVKNKTGIDSFIPDIYSGKFDVMEVGAPITRTRAFVKIEDGCESKCAYCIIPYARGSVRSNLPENILKEINNIAKEGCPEVVLTGIETASYGKDFKNGYSLADLMMDVSKIDGIERIRLSSLDPSSITPDFTDKIKENKKVMPHFHISMQSGNTKILNLMRRKYNIDMAKANLDYLRKCMPGVMFSADVITGFPGETDEDFSKTLEFFRQEKFLHLHIFPYSKREGTPAATMKNQVEECVKKQRLHALEEMQKVIKKELLQTFIDTNSETEVLFETFDGTYICGHTPNFIECKVPYDKRLSGKILKVKPLSTDGEYIYGKLLD